MTTIEVNFKSLLGFRENLSSFTLWRSLIRLCHDHDQQQINIVTIIVILMRFNGNKLETTHRQHLERYRVEDFQEVSDKDHDDEWQWFSRDLWNILFNVHSTVQKKRFPNKVAYLEDFLTSSKKIRIIIFLNIGTDCSNLNMWWSTQR